MSLLESVARRIEDADALDAAADLARSTAHERLVEPSTLDAVLGGAWLGHRVHPVAAQVPLGAWGMAVLLDLVDGEKHAAAVDTLLATGCLAALPTALTGAHDLGTTTGSDTRVVLVHAGTMDASLGLFAVAWIKHRRGDRRGARRLALAGTVVAGAGAWLGGHLTYRLGVGVED
ncbi:DUF2231 domain-containing protein [Nocardioides sp. Soil805]|uniref:DUF2231 domain-containing protein n=1 Tax=Nocardioides sp. Soil805 TaxID=1736416 RepID=UPI0007034AAE|nr:DUF2231 domain-containing protein [Nocardioides sp. Soil805]KRF37656.1 hypothetical protein ASG94_10270 [Nocardioides sp. Soil805]